MKKVKSILKFTLYFMFMHTFIFGVLIFNVYPSVESMPFSYDIDALKSVSEETTYAYILEDRAFSFDARLALIDQAKTSIDISYYTVHGGKSRDIFYGALLNAADRGVMVRFVIDGVIHEQRGRDKVYFDALVVHENIEVVYYEPYHLLRPYAIQNRLHDKLIIIDEKYGLTGGRNIGDRYYEDLPDARLMTYDRDILVFGETTHSTVVAMKTYFDELIAYEANRVLTRNTTNRVVAAQQTMLEAYQRHKDMLDYDHIMTAIHTEAHSVERATFIHSPLERLHKAPVVYHTLAALADEAETWFVQSPYLILNRPMHEMMPSLEGKDITVLTNNIHENPNAFALSGYIRYRNLIAQEATLYEHQAVSSLHAKTYIFDDVTVIGSMNMDPRSYSLSTESVIVIYDEAFARHTESILNTYIANSLEVTEDGAYLENENVVEVPARPIRHALVRALSGITVFFDSML